MSHRCAFCTQSFGKPAARDAHQLAKHPKALKALGEGGSFTAAKITMPDAQVRRIFDTVNAKRLRAGRHDLTRFEARLVQNVLSGVISEHEFYKLFNGD